MKFSLESIVNVVFMFAGKYIKGYRTILVAAFTFIVGAWEWITGSGLFGFLCASSEQFNALAMFCDVTEAKFYAIILTVVGVMNAVLRKLTDTPIGSKGTSNLMVGRKKITWITVILVILGAVFAFAIIFIALPLILNGI